MIGFENIKSDLTKLFAQSKLPHGILIYGKSGIGKKDFAINFALEILNSNNKNHPDLLLIEKDEGKRDLGIDKIRQISEFLKQTSAISKYRFIVIDNCQDFNKSSANALLKNLEEPNKNCFLILITNSIHKILPTIKSRCNIIKINDFSFETFKKSLENLRPKALPKLKEDEIVILSQICDNAPFKANKYGDELIFIYENFLKSIENNNIEKILFKKILEKDFNFSHFYEMIDFFALRFSKFLSGKSDNFLFNEKNIFQKLSSKITLKQFFEIYDEIKNISAKSNSLNLDKKLVLVNIFNYFNYV